MSTRGSPAAAGAGVGKPSAAAGGPTAEPRSRRAITRPPALPAPSANGSRKTAHAKLESSSMSMSGSSAGPEAGMAPAESRVRSCGESDSRPSNTLRAKTRPASPHTTIATPSAATAMRERPVPTPAGRAGSTSSGAPISENAPVSAPLRATMTSLPAVNDTNATLLIDRSTDGLVPPATTAGGEVGESVAPRTAVNTAPPLENAYTSRPPSAAATTGCELGPGSPASSCSGGCQAPLIRREVKTWSTPPSSLTYVSAPVPSRATSRPPTRWMPVPGPSIGSPGTNWPTSARAAGAARARPARAVGTASRRRLIGLVKLLWAGGSDRGGRGCGSCNRPRRRKLRRAPVGAGPQPVEQQLEVPAPVEFGVGHRGAQPGHQRADVVDRDVVAQDAGRLRAADDLAGEGVQLGALRVGVAGERPEPDQGVAQARVGGHDLGVVAQRRAEALPRVLDLERRADVLGRDAELLGDERLDQGVLGREVAVDRADPDARFPRHVVDLDIRAVLGAGAARRREDALAVASGVGPEGPLVGVGIDGH